MTNKTPTAAQNARQNARKNGRYKKMNPCEVCDKGLGDYSYYSDPRTCNVSGIGLVLCSKCAGKGGAMPVEDALRFYGVSEERISELADRCEKLPE